MKASSDKNVDQTSDNNNIWVFEDDQKAKALERIKTLLRSSPEFSGDDLLILADMDEMVSRDVLQSLKHCQLRHGVLSAALIMPMGNFDFAFRYIMTNIFRPSTFTQRSDHPVPGKPHSIGITTIVQVSQSGSVETKKTDKTTDKLSRSSTKLIQALL